MCVHDSKLLEEVPGGTLHESLLLLCVGQELLSRCRALSFVCLGARTNYHRLRLAQQTGLTVTQTNQISPSIGFYCDLWVSLCYSVTPSP